MKSVWVKLIICSVSIYYKHRTSYCINQQQSYLFMEKSKGNSDCRASFSTPLKNYLNYSSCFTKKLCIFSHYMKFRYRITIGTISPKNMEIGKVYEGKKWISKLCNFLFESFHLVKLNCWLIWRLVTWFWFNGRFVSVMMNLNIDIWMMCFYSKKHNNAPSFHVVPKNGINVERRIIRHMFS